MKKLIIIFLLLVLFIPAITKAAGLVPCGGPEPEKPCTACDLLVLAENVIHFALISAFTIVIILAIMAGFRMIFSGGNEANIKAAQKSLSTALIGLAIILCSYLIVNTVFWLMAKIGGPDSDYTGSWWKLECTEQLINNNSGNGNGGGDGGDGGDGGGTTENWCSDNAGYACVAKMEGWEQKQWNPNCDPASGIMPEPYAHCPEGTICCIPLDESKIIAKPKNPDTGDEGGPCEGGKLLKLCSDYSICEPRPQCEIDQGLTPTNLCHGGDVMRCPEACVHECNPEGDSSDCN